MKSVLSNKVKVIYKKGSSKLTSISIGIDAGAALEDNLLGLAHMTEHMIYKGTKNRSENEINEELTRLFGFQNAMTNFPYVIYYGSLLEEDLEEGVNLFSDIIINPEFSEDGFKEEKQVVIQELQEWDEEIEQFCEDRLFFNAYTNNRLKYPIIGRKEDLNKITLKDIYNFYKKHYSPKNTSIAIVSRLDKSKVVKILEKYFALWKSSITKPEFESNEVFKSGVYKEYKEGIKNARVEVVFTLMELTERELAAFRIFNEFFGEGVNSVLFDELRTKKGLVYDVLTNISYERHINLYKVTFTTSKENVTRALEIFNNAIGREYTINEEEINRLVKAINRKKLFKEEQGIYLAKELSVNSVMNKELTMYDNITTDEIKAAKDKVLKTQAIQIIMPKEVI